jgi:hypothetical protein
MNSTKKIAIGLGVASGALLATWLFTGNRKQKTKEFIAKKAGAIKNSFKKAVDSEESDVNYI